MIQLFQYCAPRGLPGNSGIVGGSLLIIGNGIVDESGGSGVMGDDEAVSLLVNNSDIMY